MQFDKILTIRVNEQQLNFVESNALSNGEYVRCLIDEAIECHEKVSDTQERPTAQAIDFVAWEQNFRNVSERLADLSGMIRVNNHRLVKIEEYLGGF